MKFFFLPICAIALGLGTANAETLGSIQANWDGQDRTWFITSDAGESQSSLDSPAAVVESVILWGNPSESDLAATEDVLELQFVMLRGPKGRMAVNGEMRYLLKSYHDQWDASNEGLTDVILTTYEKSDRALHISGAFHARPSRSGETREVSGSFDVTFPVE